MTGRFRPAFAAVFLAAAGLSVSGCSTLDSLNPFNEKETPLPGARKPVFPAGHPYAGPQQTQIAPTHSATAQTPPPEPEPAKASPAKPKS